MKAWIVGAIALPVAITVAVPVAILTSTVAGLSAALSMSCLPAPETAAVAVAGSGKWSSEQLTIAKTAISVGKAHSIPEKGWVVIIAAGLVESGLRNLNYGDRDSQGWLQQRPSSGWGTVEQIRTPSLAAEAFYGVAKHTNNRGLVDVFNWQNKPVGVVAQSVQVSAFPDRYAQREADARSLVAQLAGTTTGAAASTPGQDCSGSVNAVITTWNCPYDASDHACVAGMARLSKFSTVIGGQEFSSPRRRGQALAAMGSHWSMTSDNTATPIWWRSDLYDAQAQGKELAFGIVHVEDAASGTIVGPRYVTWVQLREKATGITFYMINTHMMPDPEAGPKRRKVYRQHLDVLVKLVTRFRASGAPVIISADWNMRQTSSYLNPLKAAGGLSQAATLGVRATVGKATSYDALWLFGATPAAQKVTAITGDHRAMTVTFVGAGASAGGGPVPASFNQQGNPRTVEQAIAWITRAMPSGAPGEPVLNACERYQNLAYGLGGGYPTAIAHWNAPGPKQPGTSTPPRGALVYFRTSNAAGHVALSLGNGVAVSTDYNSKTHRYQAGMLSAGPISDISRAMGGPVLGWRAPNFRVGSGA